VFQPRVFCLPHLHKVPPRPLSLFYLFFYEQRKTITAYGRALDRRSSYYLTGFFYLKYSGALRGDVDGSGIVDTTDAQLVLQYATGTSVDINTAVADFNSDGCVNTTDANLIMKNATLQ